MTVLERVGEGIRDDELCQGPTSMAATQDSRRLKKNLAFGQLQFGELVWRLSNAVISVSAIPSPSPNARLSQSKRRFSQSAELDLNRELLELHGLSCEYVVEDKRAPMTNVKL